MEAGGLRAGVGRVSIVPPLTAPHAGWGAQTHIVPDGIDSDLWATVLVVEAGETAAFVDLDLVIVSREESDAVRAAVAAVLGVPSAAVRVSVTHNHAGPPPSAWDWVEEGRAALRGYYALLPETVAGAARLAAADLRPARVGVGRGESRVAVNRREAAPGGRTVTGVDPGGPVDPEVLVLRLDGLDGAPLAAVVGYTMHPTTLGPGNRLLSPDWPGAMKQTVEAVTGATCLFAQGATGDVGPGPIGFTDDVVAVRRLGAAVGCEAARVWLGLRLPPVAFRHERVQESGAPLGRWIGDPLLEPAPVVRTLERAVPLPLRPQPTIAEAEVAVASAGERLDALRTAGAAAAEIEAATFVVKRATMARQRARAFGSRDVFPLAVHVLRIGPAAFVGVEAEPFCQAGLAVKAASPLPFTWFGGYTGGWFGYVPTDAEIPRGGYEVETSPYAAGAATALEAGALAAVRDLVGQE